MKKDQESLGTDAPVRTGNACLILAAASFLGLLLQKALLHPGSSPGAGAAIVTFLLPGLALLSFIHGFKDIIASRRALSAGLLARVLVGAILAGLVLRNLAALTMTPASAPRPCSAKPATQGEEESATQSTSPPQSTETPAAAPSEGAAGHE